MLLQVRRVSNAYITKAYFAKKQSQTVLDGVDLDMPPGEILGLVGESGCGKTTLGRCILGLIGYEGSISIDGLPQDRKRRRELARKVQAVFQDPVSALNPAKRVGWLMEEPLRIHRIGTKQERIKKVDETLELIGLDGSYKNRRTPELSGGQRQRICIGSALMLEPKLIIADEAISSLDVSVGAQILNLFQDLHRRLGLGLLFISHNLRVVYHLCDRIAVMYRGQIVEIGGAEAVYSAPAHPYTRLLLDSAPEIPASPPEDWGCAFASRCAFKTKACKKPPELTAIERSETPHLARCWNYFPLG
ncbi:MAG: ABC transporter ATP-binding protein [Spirochaetaceae bacterium]|jgi:oligopeptide/dipeptide ABC transporter ATP-binding protein|nr:ABC transporter ATP-binding protein [Spirochaetaceae bacterium]